MYILILSDDNYPTTYPLHTEVQRKSRRGRRRRKISGKRKWGRWGRARRGGVVRPISCDSH